MIQLYHVSKTYSGNVRALTDVSLTIREKEFVFVTGASGAGKTTLLRLLFKAEESSNGQIIFDGRNIAKIPKPEIPYLRRGIGVVFQDFKLIEEGTVFMNVALTLTVLGIKPFEVKRRVWEILKKLSLYDKVHETVNRLSGGEQQRVAIARALVNNPPLILADEPTGNVDWDLSITIFDLLEELNFQGTTIIVATNDRNIIEHYKKRVVTLTHGTARAHE